MRPPRLDEGEYEYDDAGRPPGPLPPVLGLPPLEPPPDEPPPEEEPPPPPLPPPPPRRFSSSVYLELSKKSSDDRCDMSEFGCDGCEFCEGSAVVSDSSAVSRKLAFIVAYARDDFVDCVE